jgi:hypothetical protein
MTQWTFLLGRWFLAGRCSSVSRLLAGSPSVGIEYERRGQSRVKP